MKNFSNIIFTTTIVSIVIFAKIYNIKASNDNLLFLLTPTKFLVEIFTSSLATYTLKEGYFFASLNIVINKSCAGVNFFILSFCIFSIMSLFYLQKFWHKFLMMFISIFIAYILTIFATFSRILISLLLHPFKYYISFVDRPFFHEFQGGFVYLFLLVLSYIIFDKIIKFTKRE